MVSRKRCTELYDVLKPIDFILQGTGIQIKPRGYLYSLRGQETDCFIGFESIPNTENHYRLGRIFLRNFYTTLDFDKNLIMIGVNAKTSGTGEAVIQGHTELHPYQHTTIPRKEGVPKGWFVIILFGLIGCACLYFVKENRRVQK